MACPKLRVQAISCLGPGASSKPMQAVPFNSRTVRSSTTDQRCLTMAGSRRLRSSTVLISASSSCAPILRPTPQTSPTSVAAISPSSS